jgi:hypothetical protein
LFRELQQRVHRVSSHSNTKDNGIYSNNNLLASITGSAASTSFRNTNIPPVAQVNRDRAKYQAIKNERDEKDYRRKLRKVLQIASEDDDDDVDSDAKGAGDDVPLPKSGGSSSANLVPSALEKGSDRNPNKIINKATFQYPLDADPH